jgi:tetratricopeptide (TPR) repeat protein
MVARKRSASGLSVKQAGRDRPGSGTRGECGTAAGTSGASGFASWFRDNPLRLGILLVAGASLAAYANTLLNEFVYDDIFQVLGNHWIRDFKWIPEIFTNRVWGFQGEGVSNYYRPLMHVFYMLSFYFFGLKAWGFHLINILLHAGVAVLVFLLVFRLLPVSGSRFFAALAAGLLFALHPIHTEVVAWVAGIPDLSGSLFLLVALLLYMRSEAQIGREYAISLGAFFLALLSKEVTLSLLVLLPAYDWIKERRFSVSDCIRRYGLYAALALVYLIIRSLVLGGMAPLRRHSELSIADYVINVFPLLTQYAAKLFLPVNLNAFHVLHPIPSLLTVEGIMGLLIAAAFVAMLVLFFQKNRTVFFALVLTAAPLLPALYLPGLGENSFAERYLYLPSAGFVMLAALLLAKTEMPQKRAAHSPAIAVSVVLVLFMAGTVQRNAVWRDNYTLWTDTVRKSPDGAVPREALGYSLLNLGDMEGAITQFRIALQLKPEFAEAHNNLGIAYGRKGMFDAAQLHLAEAVRIKPGFTEAYNNLGIAYASTRQYDKALEQFQRAVELSPAFAEAYRNMAVAWRDKGNTDNAILVQAKVLELNPGDPDAYATLGSLYAKQGDMDRAAAALEAGLRVRPGDPLLRQKLDELHRLRNSGARR